METNEYQQITPPSLCDSNSTQLDVRDTGISIAKGLAIIFMVYGHADFDHSQTGIFGRFICVFHMPIFFFFAGYCFKSGYLSNFPLYAKKRIMGLWWPYVKYCVIFLLLSNIFISLHISDSDPLSLHSFISAVKYNILFVGHDKLLGGFWFLPALFAASIIGWGIIKLAGSDLVKLLRFLGFIVILIIIGNVYLPKSILQFKGCYGPTNLLLYTSFFILGAMFKSLNTWVTSEINNRFNTIRKRLILIGLLALFTFPALLLGKPIAIQDNLLTWSMPIYFISVVSGIIFTLLLASAIKNSRVAPFLIYTGNHTLGILTWHLLAFKLITWLIIAIEGYDITMLSTFPCIQGVAWWHWIAYTIVGVIVPLAFDRLLSYPKYHLKTTLYRISNRLRPSI